MADSLASRTVLITGGTGSFGSTMVRRLLSGDVGEVRVLSRDEAKQDDLRHELRDSRARFYLGDVRDRGSVDDAMRGVDFVFHAAALKQVPSCEFFPAQAILTNVNGSANTIESAAAAGVQSVVCLSTDKAVYPINAMGMSKAMMEKLMVAKARLTPPGGTILCGTRYGNVMASRGSVIPLFIEEATKGKPLTVTDPKMTRFLMSIEDAVDLVIYAYQHGQPGDIFVRKAPAATIETLALAVKKLFDVRNPVRIIGTRHGEKLYETLLTREEMANAEDLGDYFRIPADTRDLNYSAYFTQGQETVSHREDYHSHNTRRLDVDETLEMLRKLDLVQAELRRWNESGRTGARLR